MKQHIRILSLAAGAILLASCAGTENGGRREKHRDNDRYNNKKNLDDPPSGGESQFLRPADNTAPPSNDANGQTKLTPIDSPSNDNSNPTPPPPEDKPATAGPTTPPPAPPPAPPGPASTPYGKPVPGKKGFVTSPFDAAAGMIDVRDIAPGTKVKDPYTGKVFLVP